MIRLATAAGLLIALAVSPTRAAGRHSKRVDERTGRLVPAWAELVKAHRRSDRAALGRTANRLGPARLVDAIAAPESAVAVAALAAVPLARGSALLIAAIAGQLAAPEPARAIAAASALGIVMDGDVVTALDDWDVPPDVVAGACAGLSALAANVAAPEPSRIAALAAAASAARVCGAPAAMPALARDPSPAVRRAALLAAAAAGHAEAALRAALDDPDRGVAAVAAATDCRIEQRTQHDGRIRAPDPQAVAVARAANAAPTTSAEDAVEMLDCLAAARTAADHARLDQLRRGPPSPLRDRAVELGEAAAPPPSGRGKTE